MPDITLEKLATNVDGEDKQGFLRFIRRILRWLPEERPTAEELFFDPWLIEGLAVDGSSGARVSDQNLEEGMPPTEQ